MRCADLGWWIAVYSNFGSGDNGMRTVDLCDGVGVSSLYLCPSTSNVNRNIPFPSGRGLGCISVVLLSKAPIDTDNSSLVKLSAFVARSGDDGVVRLPNRPVNAFVIPPLLLPAASNRSSSFSSSGLGVRLRIVKEIEAIVRINGEARGNRTPREVYRRSH